MSKQSKQSKQVPQQPINVKEHPIENCEILEDSWRRCTCKVFSKETDWCKKNRNAKQDPETGRSCYNEFAVCTSSVGRGALQPCLKDYPEVDPAQFSNPNIRTDYYFKGKEPSPLGKGYCAVFTKVGTRMNGNEPGSVWVVQNEGVSRRWRRV